MLSQKITLRMNENSFYKSAVQNGKNTFGFESPDVREKKFSTMKITAAATVLASLAVAEVFCASLYGEKEDALDEIGNRFREVKQLGEKLLNDIGSEKNREEKDELAATKEEETNKRAAVNKKFFDDVLATARTAIAKGKPLQAIDCIANVLSEGISAFDKTSEEFADTVDKVLDNRKQTLDFNVVEVELIKRAANDLREESENKIKEAKSGISTLKADALKKMDSVLKQLHEIENRINSLSLKTEYINLRRKICSQYDEMIVSLNKRLLKCVS